MHPDGNAPQTSGGDLVQSVARAVSLLRCFAEGPRQRALTDLAHQTGLTMSTAHRLLRTLTAAGMLTHDAATERYLPGPGLLELSAALVATDEFASATDILEALVVRTGETATLGVRRGNDVVVVRQVESPAPLRFGRPLGTTVPLHVSAMGKALLAFGPDQIRHATKVLEPLTSATYRTLTDVEALNRDLEQARGRGYTFVDEEQHLGLRSIGAPVFSPDGVARAAVSVAGPAGRFPDDDLPTLGRTVAAAAGAIQLHPFLAGGL